MNIPSTRSALYAALRLNSDDLYKFFIRRLDREEAADALAKVLLAAWKRNDKVPVDGLAARKWLFGIARNTLLHSQRGQLRRSAVADRLRAWQEPRFAPPSDASLEVKDALLRIPSDHAEIVRLVHWDGFSLVETAELLGIPASTARGRYQRAKQLLSELLRPMDRFGRVHEFRATSVKSEG